MRLIDNFLNGITMYRLMLYYLIFLSLFASGLSFAEILPFGTFDILGSTIYLIFICWVLNKLLANIFKVSPNPESALITGLILSLIIGPGNLTTNFLILSVAGISAIASKYFIAWKGRHIFNPAAFGVVFVAVVLHQGASWWIGSEWMSIPILFGGCLVFKKIKRFRMGLIFLFSSLLPGIGGILSSGYINELKSYLIISPILFFTFVMLSEPQTSPYKSVFQMLYAVLLAGCFWLFASIFQVFYPLELALLSGNIFAYIFNGSFRQTLKLREKKKESSDVISFLFEPTEKFNFESGQYLEWTLSHSKADNRGIRRYFTISSSPTEDFLMLSTKFSEKSSSFKTALQKLETGEKIIVSNLAGEFTLPKDLSKKLVFLAGGIGITPFRSMIKYLIDTKEKRNIVLFFSNKTSEGIVFKDLFDKAKEIGLKTVYVSTDVMGYVDDALIKKEVPEWNERTFYASGPEPMVKAFEKMLSKMGLPKNKIKIDYFPGYA